MSPATEAAPAKLNLALHVRGRRTDGYHDLETVFAFTAFGDTLTVTSHDALTLTLTGPFAAAVEGDNLVIHAARALAAAAGVEAHAALTLDKHIPVAAGLGGGSADAAAALRLLNRAWKLDWPPARLLPIAAALGADIPACLLGGTQLGTGRGEALRPLALDVAGTPLLLVNPGVAVATGPVFTAWDGIDRGALEPKHWASARNDLAVPAIALVPAIGVVLRALDDTGATLVRMSGSGATCFALYADQATRDRAHAALAVTGWWTATTTLL